MPGLPPPTPNSTFNVGMAPRNQQNSHRSSPLSPTVRKARNSWGPTTPSYPPLSPQGSSPPVCWGPVLVLRGCPRAARMQKLPCLTPPQTPPLRRSTSGFLGSLLSPGLALPRGSYKSEPWHWVAMPGGVCTTLPWLWELRNPDLLPYPSGRTMGRKGWTKGEILDTELN